MVESGARDLAGSPDRFGYEWNAYGEILPEYEEQFRRWTVHLAPAEWRGKSFLDVGCGMGRNSFWPMHYGAREGCAVDIDERSLAQARRNLASFATVEVSGAAAIATVRPNAFPAEESGGGAAEIMARSEHTPSWVSLHTNAQVLTDTEKVAAGSN